MKALLSLLLLVSSAAFAVNPHFDEARAGTVYIGVGDGHGTGVAINDHCALTAAHVVSGAKSITLIDQGGSHPAVALSDEAVDLAVVCVASGINAKSVRIARTLPPRYTPVFSLGFPLQEAQILTEGRYQENDMVTAEIAPGNSGGGVFNEETGQLIGLSDAIDEYHNYTSDFVFPHLQTIIDSVDIIKFLDAHKVEYQS